MLQGLHRKITDNTPGIALVVIGAVACSALLLGAYSCSGSSKVQPATPAVGENPNTPDAPNESAGGFGLADPTSLIENHSVAALQDGWTRDGSEFEQLLPNNLVAANGSSGVYSPDYVSGAGASLDDLAYGLYVFEAAEFSGDTTIHFAWETAPLDYSQLWIGVGHFQLNTWKWFQPGSANQVYLSSFSPYRRIWSDGAMVVAVVMTGNEPASLSRTWLGTQVPADTIFAVPAKTLVDPGEEVLVTVYVNETALPMQSASARILVTEGNELVLGSFNVGTPGGNARFPDGVWVHSGVSEVMYGYYGEGSFAPQGYTALDYTCAPLLGNNIESATGGLFNFRLKVNQTTELKISRVSVDVGLRRTYYTNSSDYDNHFWANDTNAGQPKIIVRGSPTAVLEADVPTGDTPLEVNFDASESWDELGSIVKYEFDFGEGEGYQDYGENPLSSHIYEWHGENVVMLKVTDNSGQTDITSTTIAAIRYDEVEDNDSPDEANPLPAFSFTGFRGNLGFVDRGIPLYDGDELDHYRLELEKNVRYRFVGSVADPSSLSLAMYLLYQGDNAIKYSSRDWLMDGIQSLDYRPGLADMDLVLAIRGNTVSQDYLLTGMRWPPDAVLRSMVTSGDLPFQIYLDANDSRDYEGKDPVRVEFDFDDGEGFINYGVDPYVSHTYIEEGLHFPKVKIVDDEGNYDIAYVAIYAGQEYDEFEPNNPNEKAQRIRLPLMDFRGSCGNKYDYGLKEYIYRGFDGSWQDYFYFYIEAGSVLHLSLSSDSSTGELDLLLLDAARNILASSETNGDFKELVYTVLPEDTDDLYILVEIDQSGNYSDYLLSAEILDP